MLYLLEGPHGILILTAENHGEENEENKENEEQKEPTEKLHCHSRDLIAQTLSPEPSALSTRPQRPAQQYFEIKHITTEAECC